MYSIVVRLRVRGFPSSELGSTSFGRGEGLSVCRATEAARGLVHGRELWYGSGEGGMKDGGGEGLEDERDRCVAFAVCVCALALGILVRDRQKSKLRTLRIERELVAKGALAIAAQTDAKLKNLPGGVLRFHELMLDKEGFKASRFVDEDCLLASRSWVSPAE